MQKEQPLIIALAADLQYETQVMTLIKSLCYHHKKIKIYLLHKTYANEWFELLNKNLKQLDLNNEVVSITVGLDLTQYKPLSHITESTFYRLFASYIPENRVHKQFC